MTASQLADAGLSGAAISKRVLAGRLHRVHRAVYAVGGAALSDRRRWMAAVLACGDGSVLSHCSAAALWGLLDPVDGPIDVSVPSGGGRARRQGLRVHRRPALASSPRPQRIGGRGGDGATRAGRSAAGARLWTPPPALTVHDLIPVTAPWLTILDLRDAVEARHYRRALREAERRRFALSPLTPTDRTRSDLERMFLELCRRFGIPAPEVNVRVGRWTVDFLWRARRLVVETDSWATHGGSVAFEADHERDLDLRRRGFSIRRYTEAQVDGAPDLVAADLAAALGPR